MDNTNHWEKLPQGFRVRPARLGDIDQAVELFNACSRTMIGKDDFTATDKLNDWQTPNFDLEKSTRLVINNHNEVVGYTEVGDVWNPAVHPFLWGRVHPNYEGIGIGSEMLNWSIDRSKEVLDRVPQNARVAARAYAISTYEPSKQLLEDHHFELIRHSWQMKINLDQSIPEPAWPEGIHIRTYNHDEDGEAVYLADEDAFRDHWGFIEEPFEEGYARWLHHMVQDEEYDPDLWFLALDGEEIAAAALGRRRSWESEDTGWVRSLFVRKAWRRRGLALALLLHTFREFQSRGKKKVGLGVDAQNLTGATRLYEKAGMRIFRQYDQYEIELRPGVELRKE
jgi:mycothiol synthase